MAKQGKSSKADRKRPWCKAYRTSARREFNKARRLRKHLIYFPSDKSAKAALAKCKIALSPAQQKQLRLA